MRAPKRVWPPGDHVARSADRAVHEQRGVLNAYGWRVTTRAVNSTPPGRPPAARNGIPLTHNGRLVIAGVGSFLHPVSARASVADLWSTMDIAAAGGETALQRRPARAARLDAAAKARLKAYVHQARQYYEAVAQADPVAKPLLAYYFVLNAAKAYLTAADPSSTATPSLKHGIGQENSHLGSPYDFSQENFQVQQSGVFHLLAQKTGRGITWRAGPMQLSRLMRYLTESIDLFSGSFHLKPALIPVQGVKVEASGTRPHRVAWLTIEVSQLALTEAGLSPRRLLAGAAAFAASFELVDDGHRDTATYQLRSPVPYGAMPGPLPGLQTAFDQSLIMRNRTLSTQRDSIVISQHVRLVSNEALTFAVMLHLSNMVRYRPHHVEELRGGNHWWLFTSWVDRACENFLLSISSRMALVACR